MKEIAYRQWVELFEPRTPDVAERLENDEGFRFFDNGAVQDVHEGEYVIRVHELKRREK